MSMKSYLEGLRVSTGYKAKDLCKKMDMTKPTLNNLSTRLHLMRVDQLESLAKILGVDPVDFFKKVLELKNTPDYELEV